MLVDVTSFSCILYSLSVDQSGGLRMEIGVLYLFHGMLVLAELIVCSTRGFACILAKWFWPMEISLSFTYGSGRQELVQQVMLLVSVKEKFSPEGRW